MPTCSALAQEFNVRDLSQEISMSISSMNTHAHLVGWKNVSPAGQTIKQRAIVNFGGGNHRFYYGRGTEDSVAYGLSDNLTVIGSSFDSETYVGRSGYWLEDGEFRLVPPTSTGTFATASRVNSRGWILGYADGQADRNIGLHIFRDGQTMAIGNPTPGYNLSIYDFADDGTIVGSSDPSSEQGGEIFTWYWKEGQGFHVEPGRLNPPYYSYKQGNANGLLAGVFSGDDSIWTEQNGVRTFTGYRGVVRSLNNRGEICIDPLGPQGWGVLQDGNFRDLADNNLGSAVGTVFDINDRGQVLGEARINDRWQQAIFTPVPEPRTFLALGGGLVWLLRRRKRPKKSPLFPGGRGAGGEGVILSSGSALESRGVRRSAFWYPPRTPNTGRVLGSKALVRNYDTSQWEQVGSNLTTSTTETLATFQITPLTTATAKYYDNGEPTSANTRFRWTAASSFTVKIDATETAVKP